MCMALSGNFTRSHFSLFRHKFNFILEFIESRSQDVGLAVIQLMP